MRTITNICLEGLDTLLLQANIRDINHSFLLCLFHGYGASAENLLSLAERLHLPENIHIAIPNAPLERFPQSGIHAFSWWNLDLDSLIVQRFSAAIQGNLESFYDELPAGLNTARQKALAWLEALRNHFQSMPLSKVILGGFSQGAMLATDIGLHVPSSLAGLVLFSGALINRPNWKILLEKAPKTPRFQSHGYHDAVLPFPMGDALHRFLEHGPIKGEFLSFSGGHEIPDEAVIKCRQHLLSWTSLL